MSNDTLKRTSHYSANRRNHLTSDGSYVYWHWDDELKREVPVYLTPGKDGVNQEWLIFLDEADHAEDLQDRYAEENDTVSATVKRSVKKTIHIAQILQTCSLPKMVTH